MKRQKERGREKREKESGIEIDKHTNRQRNKEGKREKRRNKKGKREGERFV
jgi:hypothetical protein